MAFDTGEHMLAGQFNVSRSHMIKTIADIQALPFTISPSVSDLVLHTEESGDSWIEFVPYYGADEKRKFEAWYHPTIKYEVVRFTFNPLVGVRMCGIGGEVGDLAIGMVERSRWLEEINNLQLERYPDCPDSYKDVRHFYIRGHDETIEFLSAGFTWKTVRELPN